MGALDVAIVGPALPAIGGTFAVDTRWLAWVFSIYVLFQLVGSPLLARLSDVRGRRPLYVASVGIFAVGSLLVAFSRSFAMVLVGRAVQGFGAGGILPVASAVIGDVFPPERRGRALGLVSMVFGLAFMIGPVLGGILLRFGWPWLFLVNLPLAAYVVARSLRVLPAGGRAAGFSVDAVGLASLTAGLWLLALGISTTLGGSDGYLASHPASWLLLPAAAGLLGLFWRAERRSASPLIHPSLLGMSQVRIASLLSTVAGMVEAGFVFIPSLIVTAFGLSPATASFLVLPAVLSLAVGAPITGQILDRRGSRVVVLAGALILGGALLALRWLTASLILFLAGGLVMGLGLASLVGAPLRYIALNAAGPEHRGAAQGMLTIFRSVGHLVGGPLLGSLITLGGGMAGYHLAYTVLAGVVLAGAALATGLKGLAAERATAS